MRSAIQIVSQPSVEPVTLDQVRAHCRIDTHINDTELSIYAGSARAMCEKYLNRPLISTGFVWTVAPDYAPGSLYTGSQWYGAIEFPRGSVQAISAITLTDIAGTQTVLPVAAYLADLTLDPGRLRFLYATNLIPTIMPIEHFQIAFTAGYGATSASVPMPIINAILVTALFLYERRGDDGGTLPHAAEWLMDSYRMNYFGG